ncbi:MAG: hypothetical protein JWL92_289, partial [Candidatus Nomurabacteria bacterium]|nr:hypothetical protein [Candidatus Nomurabacteria bacterium]
MKKHLKRIKSAVTNKVPWDLFVFLFIIYGVILIKLSTTYYFSHDIFFAVYSIIVGIY